MDFVLRLFNFTQPAGNSQSHADVDAYYRIWRIRTFLTLHIGYCIFYVTRKNLTSALHIFSDQLQIDIISLGLITGVFSVSYGIGKIFTGMLADRVSSRLLMGIGLLVSGIINLFYGFLTSLWMLVLFWGINGFCQATGYPAVAKSLVNWFAPSERAKIWSWWNSSHTIGTFLAGGIIVFLLKYYGDWRAIFYVPGIIGIVMACCIFASLRDTPQVVGLPAIDKFKREKSFSANTSNTMSRWQLLNQFVFRNPYIWALCLALCCAQMVRFSTLDWATKFLSQDRGINQIQVVWLWNISPLLGLPGGLIGGYLVTRFFKGFCGKVVLGYFALLAVCVYGYINFAGNNSLLLTCFLLGGINFFVDGAIVLTNVMLMRLTVTEASGTVAGFGSGLSYVLGTALGANFLAVHVVSHFGWNVLYYVCIACVLICMGLVGFAVQKEYETAIHASKSPAPAQKMALPCRDTRPEKCTQC